MVKEVWILPAALALILTGCGGITNLLTPIGQNTYECNRKENANSPFCHSFSGAELSTNGELANSRYGREVDMRDMDRLTGIADDGKEVQPGRRDSGARALLQEKPANLAGRPVREGPLVQRVWVKQFVDDSDMLIGPTILYKEIGPTRWAGYSVNTAAVADSGVFPHRAPDMSKKGFSTNGNIQKGDTQPQPESSRSNWTQPGAKAGPDEVKNPPATNRGGDSDLPE